MRPGQPGRPAAAPCPPEPSLCRWAGAPASEPSVRVHGAAPAAVGRASGRPLPCRAPQRWPAVTPRAGRPSPPAERGQHAALTGVPPLRPPVPRLCLTPPSRPPCGPLSQTEEPRRAGTRPPEADAAEGGKEGAGAPPEPSLCPSAGPTARTGPLRWPKARLAHGPGGPCILWQGESAAGPGRTAGRAVALTAASLADGLPPSRPARAGLSLPLARTFSRQTGHDAQDPRCRHAGRSARQAKPGARPRVEPRLRGIGPAPLLPVCCARRFEFFREPAPACCASPR